MPSGWLDFTFIFVFRHIVPGFENVAFTAGIGLLLVSLLRRLCSQWLTQLGEVRLRRLVLLLALVKGGVNLICGSSFRAIPGTRVTFGLQVPNPSDLLHLAHPQDYSFLHPTQATFLVSLVIAAYALFRLALRVYGVTATARYARLLRVEPAPETAAIIAGLIRECAESESVRNPRLADIPISVIDSGAASEHLSTPIVIGYFRPSIVIDTWWSDLAHTNQELLRAALAHELMHVLHGHHRMRWCLLWLSDIAALSGLGPVIVREVIACDEVQCDIESTSSIAGIQWLARAIQSATSRNTDGERMIRAADNDTASHVSVAGSSTASPKQADAVAVRLSGIDLSSPRFASLLKRRLSALLEHAEHLASHNTSPRHRFVFWLVKTLSLIPFVAISLVLVAVCLVRIYFHPA